MASQFAEAYNILGLEPGSSSQEIANTFNSKGLIQMEADGAWYSPFSVEEANLVFGLWSAKYEEEQENRAASEESDSDDSDADDDDDIEVEVNVNDEAQDAGESAVVDNEADVAAAPATAKKSRKVLKIRHGAKLVTKGGPKREGRSRKRMTAGKNARKQRNAA